MIYAFVYPEKFEGDKATKLMQVAIALSSIFFMYVEITIFSCFQFSFQEVNTIDSFQLLIDVLKSE